SEDLVWKKEDCYISLGKTSIAKQAGIEASREELGFTGYLMKTIGNTVFLQGGGAAGTLYAVYDFLKRVVGYESYAEDEVYFNAKPPYVIPDLDEKVKPCFEFPFLSTPVYVGRSTAGRRLKMGVHPNIWTGGVHNSFRLLPPEKYRKDHPEWYAVSKDGKEIKQLEYAESEHYEDIVFENLVSYLVESYKPENYREEQIYLNIGQEDYFEWSESPKAMAAYEKYGTHAALLLLFVNRLADRIAEWVDKNQPGRVVYLIFYAYENTSHPPVLFDKNGRLIRDENGQAIPVDESMRLKKNVIVRLAPLHSNWYEPFTAESNTYNREKMEGWSALGQTTLWVYGTSYHTMYANLNDFNSIQPNYQFYKKLGVKHLYDQFIHIGRGSPCFRDWRMYFRSKLAWDVDLDAEALTQDFFFHYYKDAQKYMRDYMEDVKANYEAKWREIGLDGECNWVELYIPQLWAKEDLLKWLGYFEKAYQAIEYRKDTDYATYVKLHDRITMESVSVRFLLVYLYGETTYDKDRLYEEKMRVYEDLKRFNMQPYFGYTIEDIKKNELGLSD
ncbi:MAG: DUF4838 domain-containing protein, partial [Clostridia bacterium]|nr:DUF4838 domain-containing protein [Clostridia bacterium]